MKMDHRWSIIFKGKDGQSWIKRFFPPKLTMCWNLNEGLIQTTKCWLQEHTHPSVLFYAESGMGVSHVFLYLRPLWVQRGDFPSVRVSQKSKHSCLLVGQISPWSATLEPVAHSSFKGKSLNSIWEGIRKNKNTYESCGSALSWQK